MFDNVCQHAGMGRPRGFRLSPPAWADALRYAGLTLTEASERSGIPRSTLSSLLGGHHRATATQARRISSTLGCRPETLFPSMLPGYCEAGDPVARR
jgi:lambda repressor-like predicted transcriptional regulator